MMLGGAWGPGERQLIANETPVRSRRDDKNLKLWHFITAFQSPAPHAGLSDSNLALLARINQAVTPGRPESSPRSAEFRRDME